MKFFALLKDAQFASRIMRFKLDQTAEELMENIINIAVNKFESNNIEIDFYPDYSPNNNEIFVINDFNPDPELNILLQDANSVPVLELENENSHNGVSLSDIVAIIAVDYINNRFLIQYFEKRNIIELSRSIVQRWINDRYEFVAATSNGLSIPTDLVAIVDNQNRIKFKSFQRLRHVFDMDDYFREATDLELDNFVNNCSKLDKIQGFDIEEIDDTFIRKKITIINKTGVLSNYTVEELKTAATNVGYNIPLNEQGDKIQLPNNKKQFKDLLQFLSSNIYEDPISHTTRITNSSRPYNN